jgi:hypothetical protein
MRPAKPADSALRALRIIFLRSVYCPPKPPSRGMGGSSVPTRSAAAVVAFCAGMEARQDSLAAALWTKPYGLSWMSAVKPMPRRLGTGGFVSSRSAERMAVMASS